MLAWQGCPGPGTKSGVGIKGKIALKSGRVPEKCWVRLYQQGEKGAVRESDIRSEFEQFFFIDPAKRKYYMAFACEGVEKPHETQLYELGDKVKEIDLGTILLDDSTKPLESH
jgi:hypothetical protein